MRLSNEAKVLMAVIEEQAQTTSVKVKEGDCKYFLEVIDAINNAESDVAAINGVPLNSVKVPRSVANLIQPSKVVADPSHEFGCIDVKVTDFNAVTDKGWSFDHERFIGILYAIAATQRKQPNFEVAITDVRKVVSITDVKSITVIDDALIYSETCERTPISLKYELYKPFLAGMDYATYIKRMFRTLISNF